MIRQIDIDKVLDAANIVEVVSDFVALKRAGANFKGICPFHKDTTPSLTVSPARNICKCFACGEGGGPVNFIMKHEGMNFPEAIKYLAKKYGIQIEETVLTATEQEEQKLREAMWIANDIICKEYHRQFLSNKNAQAYAYKRWGNEFCEEMEIGFCPPFAKLVQKTGIDKDIAEKLHLVGEKGYDIFGGRIIIPIRDRQHRIIGFTARILDEPKAKDGETDKPKIAKYINSSDSLIYKKSNSIFGVDLAWRVAARTERFYIVEGAPDCMRLHIIGVLNTVAPLGTAWTEDNLTTLKKVAKHLCFLPDADPPKPNERFGPGIKAVMKSGEEAMKLGFYVSVKQIPVDKKKRDPDDFCKNKTIFDGLEEQDFILWMAEMLFEDGMIDAEKGKIIRRLSSLMATMEDETTMEMYISKLTQYVGTKTMWKKEVDKQKKQLAEEEQKAKEEKESALYKEFGFNVEKDKFYYSISENGGYYVWSNFTMAPLFHIKDSISPKRIYKLINEFGTEELVEMKQEDLVSLVKFKQKIEGLGNFIWKASERELTKLKSFLYRKTETATMITQLGWQRQGFFAFGNGAFYDGKFINVDDYGIVRIEGKGNFYLPANSKIYRDDIRLFQFERRFIHLGYSAIKLEQFTEQIFRVFGDNGRVGFIFYLATLYRDVVTRSTRSFPILNLFGPKGSGKSELGHTLMSFFIIENVPPNIQNSTLPALNDTVAAVANALVHIDEYKNNLDIAKHEFLKGLWDGTGRTRINMDEKKKETTAVDSGVILSGQEMPTADIALFSRLIFLSFSRSSFSDLEKKDFQILKVMRAQGMSHLTLELLKHRNRMEAEYPVAYHKTMNEVSELLSDLVIEDRILMNWVAPLAVFNCLEAFLKTSLSYKQMLGICVEGIKFQNAQCRQSNELAAFWNMVQFLVSEGEIIEGGDFRIEYIRQLKTDLGTQHWIETKPVLMFQKSRIFMLYKKYGKAVGDTLLPEHTLKYYLENSRGYLGEKASVRYTVYHRGIVKFQKEGDTTKEAKTVQRSYCFDYKVLVKMFNINLEQENPNNKNENDDDDDDVQEQEKPAPPKQGVMNFN